MLFATPPFVIFIHLGGNDLVNVKTLDIKHKIETEVAYLREAFPDTTLVWIDILSRSDWRGSLNGRKPIEKKRRQLNKLARRIIMASGKGNFISPEIDVSFLRPDGVHLGMVGIEFYLIYVKDMILKYKP